MKLALVDLERQQRDVYHYGGGIDGAGAKLQAREQVGNGREMGREDMNGEMYR